MLEPPLRRKPATELESKLSAGQPIDLDELLAEIDKPMHAELVSVFRSSLSQDEREDLARDVFVELCETPTKYDWRRASIRRFCKIRVRTLALDYLEDRKKAHRQQRLFDERGHLQLASASLTSSMETSEAERKFSDAVDRTRVAILTLPPEQRRVAAAYEKYGPENFAARLASELDVSPNRVSQWWTRAKRTLRDAIGPEMEVFE